MSLFLGSSNSVASVGDTDDERPRLVGSSKSVVGVSDVTINVPELLGMPLGAGDHQASAADNDW